MYITATVEDKMNKDIAKVLITEQEIDSAVRRLASEIDKDYKGQTKRFITNLTEFLNAGSFSFVKRNWQIPTTGLASNDKGLRRWQD